MKRLLWFILYAKIYHILILSHILSLGYDLFCKTESHYNIFLKFYFLKSQLKIFWIYYFNRQSYRKGVLLRLPSFEAWKDQWAMYFFCFKRDFGYPGSCMTKNIAKCDTFVRPNTLRPAFLLVRFVPALHCSNFVIVDGVMQNL